MTLSIRPLVPKHPGPGTSLWKVRRTTFSRTSELGSLVRYKPPAIQVPAKFCSSLWGRCIGWGWGSGGVKGWLGGRKHGGGGMGRGWRGGRVGLCSFPKPLGRARGGERKIGRELKIGTLTTSEDHLPALLPLEHRWCPQGIPSSSPPLTPSPAARTWGAHASQTPGTSSTQTSSFLQCSALASSVHPSEVATFPGP